jgi:hypothetical protein
VTTGADVAVMRPQWTAGARHADSVTRRRRPALSAAAAAAAAAES